MALFLDTSALVKLFVQEQASQAVRQAVARDPALHVGCLTSHEFLSALQRKVRSGALTPVEASEIRTRFRRLMADVVTIPFSDALSRRALELLERYGTEGLRTLDAVQLASLQQIPSAAFGVSDGILADIVGKAGASVVRFT